MKNEKAEYQQTILSLSLQLLSIHHSLQLLLGTHSRLSLFLTFAKEKKEEEELTRLARGQEKSDCLDQITIRLLQYFKISSTITESHSLQ